MVSFFDSFTLEKFEATIVNHIQVGLVQVPFFPFTSLPPGGIETRTTSWYYDLF